MKGLLKSKPTDYESLLDNGPSSARKEEQHTNGTEDNGLAARRRMLLHGSVVKPAPKQRKQVDKGALLFALRMATLLLIGSLFVLIRAPGDGAGYPQGMWVLVTLLFVSWFPRLDAASVIEKSSQRLLGTFIGASIGLSCGFTSLAIPSHAAQATFLGFCVFTVTFLVIFLSGSLKIGQNKIMQRFNYATILCLLTFSIAILPFYTDEEPKWRKGVWRVINVILGCIIGAIGSVVLFPRSTTSILREKVDKQVKLAGDSSQAVLHAAADAFSGHLNPLALADELLETRMSRRHRHRMSIRRKSFRSVNKSVVKEDGDLVLSNYVDAINDWKATKALYPVIPYDPLRWFSTRLSKDDREKFHLKTARILAQSLRIQTMIVCLDGVIRNDMPGYDFDDDHVDFFAQVGTSIRDMLALPFDESKNGAAAVVVANKIPEIRKYIKEITSTVSKDTDNTESAGKRQRDLYTPVFEHIYSRASSLEDEEEGFKDGTCETPIFPCTSSCVLLFLQLVEQLMLRSLRLYHTRRNISEQMDELAPQPIKSEGKKKSAMESQPILE